MPTYKLFWTMYPRLILPKLIELPKCEGRIIVNAVVGGR